MYKFLLILIIILTPQEAWLSNAYSKSFIERDYALEIEDTRRVRYHTDHAAADAIQNRDIEIKKIVLNSIPGYEKIILKIKNKKIPISSYNPTLETYLVQSVEQFEEIENKKYPLNIKIKIESKDQTKETYFDLTLLSAPTGEQLKVLYSEITKIETHILPIKTLPQDLDYLKGSPISVFRYSKYFGIYLGINADARKLARQDLETVFSKRLDFIFSELENKLSDPEKIKDIGLDKAELMQKKIKNLATADVFNPYGPLYDEYARESVTLGRTQLIILFSPAEVDANHRPNFTFIKLLEEIFKESLKK